MSLRKQFACLVAWFWIGVSGCLFDYCLVSVWTAGIVSFDTIPRFFAKKATHLLKLNLFFFLSVVGLCSVVYLYDTTSISVFCLLVYDYERTCSGISCCLCLCCCCYYCCVFLLSNIVFYFGALLSFLYKETARKTISLRIVSYCRRFWVWTYVCKTWAYSFYCGWEEGTLWGYETVNASGMINHHNSIVSLTRSNSTEFCEPAREPAFYF